MEAAEILKQFNDIWELRHEYATDWKKRTGGKVLGYFCTYAPEEVLYAANVLPVRILGLRVFKTHFFELDLAADLLLGQFLLSIWDLLIGVKQVQNAVSRSH